MYCCLCGGCGPGSQQVNVNYLSSENPPINGALPVRAQRFLQTDNDLTQSSVDGGRRQVFGTSQALKSILSYNFVDEMTSPCNLDDYGDFLYMEAPVYWGIMAVKIR